MKTIFYITTLVLIYGFAKATYKVNEESALKKCVGQLMPDGSINYPEDCIAPTKTIVKKGVRPNITSGPVDTPQKAMELYDNTKNETTTIVKEKDSSDQ